MTLLAMKDNVDYFPLGKKTPEVTNLSPRNEGKNNTMQSSLNTVTQIYGTAKAA